tara:strand:- start:54 stop:446 length:393 start_codon:yes stop_codon:yes gene_type:complete
MWPFSKKPKVIAPPKVPASLRAPLPKVPRGITAEQVQAAAGVKKPSAMKTEDQPMPVELTNKPFFLRAQSYRQILDITDAIHESVSNLEKATRELKLSDSNEDKNFEKLKRDLQSMNSKLFAMDKVFFKQ